jgi:hypothetical protein
MVLDLRRLFPLRSPLECRIQTSYGLRRFLKAGRLRS